MMEYEDITACGDIASMFSRLGIEDSLSVETRVTRCRKKRSLAWMVFCWICLRLDHCSDLHCQGRDVEMDIVEERSNKGKREMGERVN